MQSTQFKIVEAAKEGRRKVHPVFAVILAIVFLTLGELFMLFMLFLPKAETLLMKAIYSNIEMILTFGGAIFFVFFMDYICGEKINFIHWILDKSVDKKVFERCINRFYFYFNTSHVTFINWKCTTTNATNYTNRYTWNCGFFSCFFNTRCNRRNCCSRLVISGSFC